MRDELLTRMIRIYGFEHPAVIQFSGLMETAITDECLETIVKYHEANPIFEEE